MNYHLIILLFLASALAGCGNSDSRPQPVHAANSQALVPGPFQVSVFDVQPTPASDLLIPAAVSVEGAAFVLAQREGTITRVEAQEGVRIAARQLLARFDDTDQRAQLRQAELEVKRLEIEARQYEALVAVNRNELSREMVLAKQGLSSARDVERAQYRLDAAISEHEKTLLAIQNAQAKLDAVKIELEKSTVRAPVAGVITHRYVNAGTGVAKNEKLFEISPTRPLLVKFQLPQPERTWVRTGQVVALLLEGDDRVVARARIRRADAVADATSNTLGYIADVIGGVGLMPGLTVNVRIARGGAGASFWIPRLAFPAKSEPAAGVVSKVLVLENGKCAERAVRVHALDGDQVEIESGLNPGDRVIIAPPAGLKSGDLIEVR